jgi:hypothetical protein
VTQATADAYAALAALRRSGLIQFVTSEKSYQEVRRATNQNTSAVLQFLVSAFDEVAPQTIRLSGTIGGAPLGSTPLGGDWTDLLYEQLKSIFDSDDAEHIVHAVRADCDYFLTLDVKTILKRVSASQDAVAAACGKLKFVSPEDLVADLMRRS